MKFSLLAIASVCVATPIDHVPSMEELSRYGRAGMDLINRLSHGDHLKSRNQGNQHNGHGHPPGCNCGQHHNLDASARKAAMEKPFGGAELVPLKLNMAPTGHTLKQTQAWIDSGLAKTPPKHPVDPWKSNLDREQCQNQEGPEQLAEDMKWLRRAIQLGARNAMLAKKGEQAEGGLFGAVIVKDGKILGEGWNTVLKEQDPTRHGEMNALRQATHQNGHDLKALEGATLYTSGEPCPMCYAAVSWAKVGRIVYASDYGDALHSGGFRDEPIRKALSMPMHLRGKVGMPAGCQMAKEEGREWWHSYNNLIWNDGKGAGYRRIEEEERTEEE